MKRPRGMTGTARELHDWIVDNGLGQPLRRTGSGHIMYRLRNGANYVAASTSNRPTTLKNGKATVRRLLKEQR